MVNNNNESADLMQCKELMHNYSVARDSEELQIPYDYLWAGVAMSLGGDEKELEDILHNNHCSSDGTVNYTLHEYTLAMQLREIGYIIGIAEYEIKRGDYDAVMLRQALKDYCVPIGVKVLESGRVRVEYIRQNKKYQMHGSIRKDTNSFSVGVITGLIIGMSVFIGISDISSAEIQQELSKLFSFDSESDDDGVDSEV